ncbi:methyltransferase domain-containing protein [Kribbella sp. CA-247076]|uniref:methyltransferase domain-containing protein n=1 Tax=Kribbella sp. CA-247076 TaxID=3239941 RepID=UPI003D8C0B2D
MTETDESEFGLSRGSFKLADVEAQDLAKLTMILDQMAQQPAVQTLRRWALEQLAPTIGETAIDVGSGTGEDVVELAKLVGPTGRALGIEPSPALRAEATRRAEALDGAEAGPWAGPVGGGGAGRGPGTVRGAEVVGGAEAVPGAGAVRGAEADGGLAGVEFVDGFAGALPLGAGSVDVVRCERVLQHVADPAGAVADMARVLRPGGRIVLIDTDWATAIVHPADPAVLQRMVDLFLAESANPYSGRQLRGLLAGAGLEITGETAATWIERQEGARQGFASMMHLAALTAGVITKPEADAFAQGLAEAADRGAFHLSLTMYAVSARKPN